MNLFDAYFTYRKVTEVPLIFHRWSLISCVGAFLGRQCWFPFGSSRIFPNMYVQLIGSPGTRKSTAIKQARSLISSAGYSTFSAEKTRKEKFLIDLEGASDDGKEGAAPKNMVLENLFGASMDTVGAVPREVFIVADEFNEFIGSGDLEFLSLLGALWDWDSDDTFYRYRLKNSKSVSIFQPTISILSGNTHAGFQQCFPPEAIGQGFLSRIILIYSDPSGVKITIPPAPDEKLLEQMITMFAQIKDKFVGALAYTQEAYRMLDMIYKTWLDLEDQRFKHYSTRRFTHLIKLSIICAATRIAPRIDSQDVLLASTLLAYAESFMPKALGEFGKSKNSEAANKLMAALYETKKPLKLNDLWKIVSNDLEKMSDLSALLGNLINADKIQTVPGEGFLPKQKPLDRKLLFVDFKLLKEFTGK